MVNMRWTCIPMAVLALCAAAAQVHIAAQQGTPAKAKCPCIVMRDGSSLDTQAEPVLQGGRWVFHLRDGQGPFTAAVSLVNEAATRAGCCADTPVAKPTPPAPPTARVLQNEDVVQEYEGRSGVTGPGSARPPVTGQETEGNAVPQMYSPARQSQLGTFRARAQDLAGKINQQEHVVDQKRQAKEEADAKAVTTSGKEKKTAQARAHQAQNEYNSARGALNSLENLWKSLMSDAEAAGFPAWQVYPCFHRRAFAKWRTCLYLPSSHR